MTRSFLQEADRSIHLKISSSQEFGHINYQINPKFMFCSWFYSGNFRAPGSSKVPSVSHYLAMVEACPVGYARFNFVSSLSPQDQYRDSYHQSPSVRVDLTMYQNTTVHAIFLPYPILGPSFKSWMPSSHRSDGSGSGSGNSNPNVPRRPKSPVAMYQMDYGFGAPKPPRPLVKLEPKAPRPKSRQGTLSGNHPTRSHSLSVSSHGSFASNSPSTASFATSSSSSSSSRRPSVSLPRIFDKLRKPPAMPITSGLPHSPDTPSSVSISPPFEAEIIQPDEKELPVAPVLTEASDNNEIVEELREPLSHHVTSQIHSRRTSLTLPSPPHKTSESAQPPPRPPRDPNRTSTQIKDRPLSQTSLVPETPSTPIFRPLSGNSSLEMSPRDSLEFQNHLDMRTVVESHSSSLTRSKSVLMTMAARPDSPFVDTAPMQSYFATALSANTKTTAPQSAAARRERRQGWSGEWNLHDMQDVIQKLRELK
ncbi:hypothetical protein BT96DRAFT_715817 [Gymnopus androsaceus JB14]|uniref:Uncharacterized protein n=1 Tax=Gymnopus androsaceus JB14 TaxID=1447944 RepID=A0A6A4HMF7_9AGAR|nr:hypothetical protein BT96DRAFT_715817 [Gymnopus androsaceus JB14]